MTKHVLWLASLVTGLILHGPPSTPPMAQTQDSEGARELNPNRPHPDSYMGRAFLYRVDLAYGRAAGWIPPGTSDADAVEAARSALESRLRHTAYFTEASVLAEEGARLAAVFVGRQAPQLEEFLQKGMARPGRLSLARRATVENLGDAVLAEERSRFEAWSQAHPGTPPVFFDVVPAEEGGTLHGLRWRLPEGEGAARTAVPLLGDPALELSRTDLKGGTLGVAEGDGMPDRFLLRVVLEGEAKTKFQELRGSLAELVVCVDGAVLGTPRPDEAGSGDFLLPGPVSGEQARLLVFSVAGGALPAPLRFVEFGKRPLRGVTQEGS